jgi:putative spermidine/putrescine transport system substrate-binding protein
MVWNGAGRRLNRREFALGAGAAAATLSSTRAGAAQQIVVSDPGGPYGPAFRKAFYDPFEKETGIKVINVAREHEPVAQVQAMVKAKAITWDVVTLDLMAYQVLSRLSLLEPLNIPPQSVKDVIAGGALPDWLATDAFATVLAYRTDRYKNDGPRNWRDFWDVQKFPGTRALRRNPIRTLEQALLADGVEFDKLYPLDLDRGFRSLARIKPHVKSWWTSGAQATQLLQSGEVDMIATFNARAQVTIDAGAPVKIVWNEGLISLEGWSIPKGSPNADAARSFIAFCADAKRQAVYTETLAYGPTNLKAFEHIPAKAAQTLPTAPDNRALMRVENAAWWADNRDAVIRRFNEWLLG